MTDLTVAKIEGLHEIPIALIDPPQRVVRKIDLAALEEMTNSIREVGVLQPILVRPNKNGRYQVVFGSHRLEAVKRLGRKRILAIVRRLDETDATFSAIVENVQRNTNVDPALEGEIFVDLCDTKGWDSVRVAKKIGKSVSYVVQRMDMYRDLHPKLLKQVSERKMPLAMAHAISKHPMKEQLKQAERLQNLRSSFPSRPTSEVPTGGSRINWKQQTLWRIQEIKVLIKTGAVLLQDQAVVKELRELYALIGELLKLNSIETKT